MRRIAAVLVIALGSLSVPSVALAHETTTGPGGSTNSGTEAEQRNGTGEIDCGTPRRAKTIVGPVHIYNNGGGAEVCAGEGSPVQGRAALGSSKGGILGDLESPDYVLVETDRDTPIVHAHVHFFFPPGI